MAKNTCTNGSLFSKKPLTISETSLSASIGKYLDCRRIYNDRLNSGKINIERRGFLHLCKKGTPDRFFIIAGRIIFIEVKALGKVPTTAQTERHAELRAAGAVVIVADSFESFERQFQEVCDELKSERQKCNDVFIGEKV